MVEVNADTECGRFEVSHLNYAIISPRAQTLLFMCLRPKGLKVVFEPEFYADFENPFLTNRILCVLGEIYTFL